MSNHPFLNPHSSKILLDTQPEHLVPIKIFFSACAGTLLCVLGNVIIGYVATSTLHIKLTLPFTEPPQNLSLTMLAGANIIWGVAVSLFIYFLNRFTQRPVMIFRIVLLIFFLLYSLTILSLPLPPLLRLIGFIFGSVAHVSLATPLTRYTTALKLPS
jgi:hypothetical protein